MKVLMPILHYPPVIGGFEVFSQSIAERIGKTEDVFVVTSRAINAPNREKKGKLRIFRTSLFKLSDLSFSNVWQRTTAMVWIIFKSFKLIKKEKIDLIHSQKSAGFLSGLMGYILHKLTKVPYIITIQSADFSVYHPYLNFKPIKWIHRKVEQAVFRNAAAFHSVSNYLKKYLERYGDKKTIVIPNGVSQDFKPDLDKIKTRKEMSFDTENLIVCVSRLEPKNGTRDLIEAGKYLKDIDYKIMIIGDGSLKEKLKHQITKNKLEDKIFLIGDMVYSKIPKYVASADIFVRPSLAEGFGIVFLEAMAVNVAVIGTSVGGIPDFLHNNKTGLFCEPENPKDIAEKIKILIKDKELKEKLIKNAKKMVDEEYNWNIISERIISVYKKAIHE